MIVLHDAADDGKDHTKKAVALKTAGVDVAERGKDSRVSKAFFLHFSFSH